MDRSGDGGQQDGTGCDAFNAAASFDSAQTGTIFQWEWSPISRVRRIPGGSTEVPDENSSQRYRSFPLAAGATQQDYWFATGRRFGAQKYIPPGSATPGFHFAVWAAAMLRTPR